MFVFFLSALPGCRDQALACATLSCTAALESGTC